jgi:hypothetical protein
MTSVSAQEWKKNRKDTITRLKNKEHKVGIGTNVPTEKLTVIGGVRYDGVSNIDGTEKRYPITLQRYHVEATKATVDTTVPLNNTLFRKLCSDSDGCLITLGMRDWSDDQPNARVATGPVRFYLKGRTFRRITIPVNVDDSTLVKKDRNNLAENAFQAWACFLTDGEFVNKVGTDSEVGFGLLNFSGVGYDDPDMVCELTIDD